MLKSYSDVVKVFQGAGHLKFNHGTVSVYESSNGDLFVTANMFRLSDYISQHGLPIDFSDFHPVNDYMKLWIHKSTNHACYVIGSGDHKCSSGDSKSVFYIDINGKYYSRPSKEFYDGRFIKLVEEDENSIH